MYDLAIQMNNQGVVAIAKPSGILKPKTSFLKLPLQVYHRRMMKQAPLFDTHLAIEVLQDGGFDARQAKKRLSRLWTDL